jgi:hypothetical protein
MELILTHWILTAFVIVVIVGWILILKDKPYEE